MEQYIGLDVSLKDTWISVRQEGKRIWRGKCPSDPKLFGRSDPQACAAGKTGGVRDRAFIRVVLSCADSEEGSCLRSGLCAHAKAHLDMAPNKTDANDADGLAHLGARPGNAFWEGAYGRRGICFNEARQDQAPARWSLRRLWAAAIIAHSPWAALRPLSRNCRKPRADFIWPKTGSTTCLRRR